jgi:hypothetical protein
MMSIDELLQAVTVDNAMNKSVTNSANKGITDPHSYNQVVRDWVVQLGVDDGDKNSYRSFIHTVMAEAGVIDAKQTEMKKNNKGKVRFRPFTNSPYGEFVDYEVIDGKRVHRDTFVLNDAGIAKVNEVLQLFQTKIINKRKLASVENYRKEIQSEMNLEFLKEYLDNQGVHYTEYGEEDNYRIVFKATSVEKGYSNKRIVYTCYRNNATKCQYKNSKEKQLATPVFSLIVAMETNPLNTKQEVAKKIARIYREWWNFKFNNTTSWIEEATDEATDEEPVANPVTVEVKTITNTPTNPSNDAIMKRLDKLEQMMHLLLNHHGITIPSAFTEEIAEVKESVIPTTKEGIIQEIEKTHKPLEEQRRYKNLTKSVIEKEKNSNSKKKMQEHYNLLEERRLNTAKYKPLEGWKWDSKKGIIPLLYKISDRRTATYNTRQRRVQPFLINGKLVKEKATGGEEYHIPYGIDKLDYSYKTIFLTEGCFDSCFLKNCLAYSNWILPNTMTEVIELYRNAGFQIIHILDNYRIGDKGGKQGLACMVKNRDWFEKGDKVFDWSVFSDDKDLNDIAIHYELDEIDANTIINHSVGYEEALALYHEFCNEE